jgi:GNAT superfamily N-acetyltransferase
VGGRPDGFARALAYQRETLSLVAEQVTAIPEGWVLRTPSLPRVWSLNQVWARAPAGFEEAVALGERHLADLPHRQLVIEDDARGSAAAAEFRAAGWRAECEVTMTLARPPDRPAARAVIEAPVEEVVELMVRWLREEGEAGDRESLRQLRRHWEREWKVRHARLLGVRADDGSLAAITMLYGDGAIAQVEDVYTVPEQRGRGLARALVTRALQLALEARPELTFIVADEFGWPKQLYARLGFAPVGRHWTFHRDL